MSKNPKRIAKVVLEISILIFSLAYFMPFWMVLVNSFKLRRDAAELKLAFPSKLIFDNYLVVINEGGILKSILNGVFIATLTVVFSTIVASMAAFTISRRAGRATAFINNYLTLGIIIPVATIPTYLILHILNLINTYTGLILVFTAYAIPLSVFFYIGFIKTIPKDLDEAAIIDGCGNLKMFFTIIFPLLKPVTATVGIFNFIGVWNDVVIQLYFASPDKWSMPMGVFKFYGKYVHDWNYIFADVVMTILPVLVVYIFGQKYIIQGMTAGAVKG